MKVLQFDVDDINYKAIKPEASVYDDIEEKEGGASDALVMMFAVERGDTEQTARDAVTDSIRFAEKQKIKTLVLYPFAHISSNLEGLEKSMQLFKYMRGYAKEAFQYGKVTYAPFGWNKQLSMNIKGHPLAEQSRSYGAAQVKSAEPAKKKKRMDLSIVRKSDFSGLPETDHRNISEKLDLFSFQEVSPGMAYWHPNGYIVFKELMKYIREKIDEYGYQEIATPAFANLALWHVSGHIDHYRENMFTFESGDDEMGLKPMNCPSTILIFKSRKWSYRDLPVRFADFDKLYRNEISGALTGLFRVRELTQDDAHIFARDDQIEPELELVLKLIKELYAKFGLEYRAKLSTMPDSHLGTEELWTKATGALTNALKANGMKFEVKDKEGAFYGPKIDFDIKDSMGREWQCATVQLDYQLPKRFDLGYTGEDGKQHMPVMIHRVIYGTLERFIGVLTEHIHGKFPTWLAPVQVRVIPISDVTNRYAEEIYEKLKHEHVRVELDASDKTLEYKIRDGQMQQIPYMIIIGKKEAEAKKITVRARSGKQKMAIALSEFVEPLKKEICERVNGAEIIA